VRQVSSASEVAADHRPTVLLLDAVARSHFTPHALLALRDAGVAVLALGANGEEDVPHDLPAEALAGFVRGPIGGRQLLVGLRSALLVAAARQDTLRAKAETAARTSEITELTDIGIQLTTEKDYNKLLDLILNQARRITQSDAGRLSVVETDDRGERRLRFKLSQNDSRPDIPLAVHHADRSGVARGIRRVRGRAARDRRCLHAAAGRGVRLQPPFDQRYGYRTKSMLVIRW
jgi:hypothetical protein